MRVFDIAHLSRDIDQLLIELAAILPIAAISAFSFSCSSVALRCCSRALRVLLALLDGVRRVAAACCRRATWVNVWACARCSGAAAKPADAGRSKAEKD